MPGNPWNEFLTQYRNSHPSLSMKEAMVQGAQAYRGGTKRKATVKRKSTAAQSVISKRDILVVVDFAQNITTNIAKAVREGDAVPTARTEAAIDALMEATSALNAAFSWPKSEDY